MLLAAVLCRYEVPPSRQLLQPSSRSYSTTHVVPRIYRISAILFLKRAQGASYCFASTLPTLKFELVMTTKDPNVQIPAHKVARKFNHLSNSFYISVRVYDGALDYQRC